MISAALTAEAGLREGLDLWRRTLASCPLVWGAVTTVYLS